MCGETNPNIHLNPGLASLCYLVCRRSSESSKAEEEVEEKSTLQITLNAHPRTTVTAGVCYGRLSRAAASGQRGPTSTSDPSRVMSVSVRLAYRPCSSNHHLLFEYNRKTSCLTSSKKVSCSDIVQCPSTWTPQTRSTDRSVIRWENIFLRLIRSCPDQVVNTFIPSMMPNLTNGCDGRAVASNIGTSSRDSGCSDAPFRRSSNSGH